MPEFIMDKKIIVVLSSLVIAVIIGSLFAVAYGSYFDTASTMGLPFSVFNGINIGDYFATPTTSLSVVPSTDQGTPAPAITGCKVTNDVSLIATDGSSYSLSSTSTPWSPTYSIVGIPYNGKTLSSVHVNVNLYCDPSTLAKYNYYPILQSGMVSMTLQGKGPTGGPINIFTTSQSVNSVTVNGQTVTIASFSISASQISVALPTSQSNYYSQQSVVTTGTLNFKQGPQAYQLIATHNLSPLYTSFSLLISPSPYTSSNQMPPAIVQPVASCPPNYYSTGNGNCQPVPSGTVAPSPQPMANAIPIPAQQSQQVITCPSNTVLINNSCIDLIQNIYLAGGKTSYFLPSQNYVIYSVIVNSWSTGQPYPSIKVTNLDTGTGSINTLSPNSRGNGYPKIATGNGALIMTDILNVNTDLLGQSGRYQIQLMSVPIGSYNRPSVSQDFVIYQQQSTNYASTTGTCPQGQYPSQTSNGLVCLVSGIVQPAPVSPSSYAPVPSQSQITCADGSQPVNGQCMTTGSTSGAVNSPVSLPTQSSNNVCVTLSGNSGSCVPVNNSLGNNPVINAFQQVLLYFHAYG